MQKILLSFFVAASFQALSQKSNYPDFDRLSAPFSKPKKSQVLIVGTFHFRDAGADGYKPKHSVNITSPNRQKEVLKLVDKFASFKPTKVAIENMAERQPLHDSLYNAYLNGKYALGENEIYQVSYRVAAKMGHKNLYTVDAPRRDYEPEVDVESFMKKYQQEKYNDATYNDLFFQLYKIDDSLKSVLPLKDALYYQNTPERLNLGFGHYLIGDIKVAADGQYPGADAVTGWFNRNIRIFANLLKLAAESNDERIFFMVGAGHVPILRFLALACPEIELVDARDYLK